MQNGEVEFKMVMSNRRIRKKTMKAVLEFSGVTMIDAREQGKIKVAGEFDRHEMTKKLRKINKQADIIGVETADHSLFEGLVEDLFRQGTKRQTDGCTIM